MSITENRTQKIAYLTTFFSLYIAQAVPMSFFTTALQVVMREQAIPLSIIGLLQILKLPWIFKAFWSPAIDRYCQTIRHYKRMIIGAELVYALLIFIASLFDLQKSLPTVSTSSLRSFSWLCVLLPRKTLPQMLWRFALLNLNSADCSTACSPWAVSAEVCWAVACCSWCYIAMDGNP